MGTGRAPRDRPPVTESRSRRGRRSPLRHPLGEDVDIKARQPEPLGIIDGDSATEAIRAARRLNPEFPGELDWPAWWIDQRWCRPTAPDCAQCPLTGDCAKRM